MIGYLILYVVVISCMLVFFTKFMVYFMGKYGGETINKIHRSSEFIINTGKLPPWWIECFQKGFEKAARIEDGGQKLEKYKEAAKRKCLKQLVKLIKHFKRTSLVEDEEAREMVLNGLTRAYEEWKKHPWDEISNS